jgi:zinc protease
MRLIAAAALALLAFAASAQVPLPQGVTQVTTVEGITEYNLANGLRVLFAPDPPSPPPRSTRPTWSDRATRTTGETGMAHLLEHLMGFGTPTFPQVKVERVRRGLRANATTSYDRTNYFASFAANDDTLDWYLRWSADAMVNSFIAKKDLDTEMTVVRNEMERGETSPQRILFQHAMSAAYSWHKYGKANIGARSDVENVNIERLQAFYRTYYQPDNAVLIVTGKFDEAKTLALIAREYGKLPRPARTLQPTYTIDPEQHGERSVTVRRAGDTPLALALYHVPAGAPSRLRARGAVRLGDERARDRPAAPRVGRDEAGRTGLRLRLGAARARRSVLRRRGSRQRLARRRESHAGLHDRGPSPRHPSPTRKSSAPAPASSPPSRWSPRIPSVWVSPSPER